MAAACAGWITPLRRTRAPRSSPSRSSIASPRRGGGLVDAGVEDLDHVLAGNAVADAGLLLEEAAEALLGPEIRVHDLERPQRPGGELLGDEDRPHPAPAERPHDPVRTREDAADLRESGLHEPMLPAPSGRIEPGSAWGLAYRSAGSLRSGQASLERPAPLLREIEVTLG